MYVFSKKKKNVYVWQTFVVADSPEDALAGHGIEAVSVEQAAYILKCSTGAVHQLVRRGRLAAVARWARGNLFRRRDVEKLAQERALPHRILR